MTRAERLQAALQQAVEAERPMLDALAREPHQVIVRIWRARDGYEASLEVQTQRR